MNHPESKGILRNSQESQESGVLQWTIEKKWEWLISREA